MTETEAEKIKIVRLLNMQNVRLFERSDSGDESRASGPCCSMKRFTGNGKIGWLWVIIQGFLYLMVLFAICIPLTQTCECDTAWFLLIPLPLFAVFDAWFVLSPYSIRTKDECLDDIRSMCNYVSYYIPVSAVILAFSNGNMLREVYDKDSTAILLSAMGVVASAVTMAWVPIPRYTKTKQITINVEIQGQDREEKELVLETDKPTKELKMCYLIVCFMEKFAIIFVLAGLFRFGLVILDKDDTSMTLKCTMEEDMSLNCTRLDID